MHNILIIAPDDKAGPASAAAAALQRSGYRVARTSLDNGAKVVEALCSAFAGCPPDVILADLSPAPDCLPIRHAIRLLQRAWGDDMPRPLCLALLEPRHLALPDWLAQADDFLLPPHNTNEILARIEMLLFRKRNVHSGDRISIADITIDLAGGRAVDESGRVVPLTPREFDLLRFLATHRGKFFARDRLLDMVWGVDFDGGERTVDIHIRRLRAKLPPRSRNALETRRGVGYGLVPSL